MSTSMIVALAAVFAGLVVVLIAARSGPKVTHIETRRHEDDAQGE